MLKKLWENRVGATILLLCTYLLVFGFMSTAKNGAVITVDAPLSDSSPVIILDAGHGGIDSGCVSVNGAEEKDINLDIMLKLRDMLRMSGYDVLVTRETDKSIHDTGVQGLGKQKQSDMENRLKIINSQPNGLFVSIHQNQFTDPKYSGAQMFYPLEDAESERLAGILQRSFVSFLQPENKRETKPVTDEIYLLKNGKCPRVMAECGFLSNPDEAALLESEEYRGKVAFCLYTGILEYLSENNNL